MRRFLTITVFLGLAACSGVRGVEYSTLNDQPLPADRTVALDVLLPEGETDEYWVSIQQKVRSKLAIELKEQGTFQHVLSAGESGDYNLTVTIADLEIGRPPVITQPADTGNAITDLSVAISNAATATSVAKLPDQVLSVKVYTKLEEQTGGREVLAFRADGGRTRTDGTVTAIAERIIAGVNCYGEDCK